MAAFTNTIFILFFLVFFLNLPLISYSVNFQVSRFGHNASQILLEGDAEVSAGEIQLTNIVYVCRVGRVLYNGKIPLWDTNSGGNQADFATRFSFRIDTRNAATYGNGLAFFLAPVGFQIPPNSAGGYLGLFNTSTTDLNQTQIVMIEFDTFSNGWDPNYTHVGININSVTSAVTQPWNASLHNGDSGTAWIAYNSTTKNLTLFWSYGNGPNSSLSYDVDLRQVLPQWVIIGISAGTGSYLEENVLESWEFTSSLDMKEGSGSNRMKIRLVVGFSIIGFVMVVVGGIAVFLVQRKRKAHKETDNPETTNLTSSICDDIERGAGPRKFSYEELASATNNFSEEKKLGQGGFGGVYKGHLNDLDIPVAVKKSSKGSKQGKKQYITEVKIISMLRHRNLVQLIGWCHGRGEFFLVYEFMPNGSLDYHLFGKRNTLNWCQRYNISQGLASALLYLHDECKQCVVHRDIKSSNVMLDSSFNVKLGDFGLARLVDHDLGPETTIPAGTLGYMAPEVITTGQASKESDVYSFGVVALELVTGRKSWDLVDKESGKGIVRWMWDLYGNGELMKAVDQKVLDVVEPRQAECLIVVGLWCTHHEPSLRPSMQVVSDVLNFKAELPKLSDLEQMPMRGMHHTPRNPVGGSEGASITDSSLMLGR